MFWASLPKPLLLYLANFPNPPSLTLILSSQPPTMVSPIKLVFRVSHLLGAVALFVANAVVLLSPPAAAYNFLKQPFSFTLPQLTAGADAVQATVNIARLSFWIEIVGGVMVSSGIVNAILLAPKKNMRNAPKQLSTWRRLVYGLKLALFVLTTPATNKIIEVVALGGFVTEDVSLEVQGEILRTAALVKIGALTLGVVVGSFCRYYREEASAASTKAQGITIKK